MKDERQYVKDLSDGSREAVYDWFRLFPEYDFLISSSWQN